VRVSRQLPVAEPVTRVVAQPRTVWIGIASTQTPDPSLILRIDARSGRVVGRPIRLGFDPLFNFTVGGGSVWVTYPRFGVVAQVDPRPAARATRSRARRG